jgi:tetratricopeptide (TPR) repeat protein
MRQLKRYRSIGRIFGACIYTVALVLLLWQSLRWAWRPDANDLLRSFDQQFVAQHYYEALRSAEKLVQRSPESAAAWTRMGMIRTLRAEANEASIALSNAIRLGVYGHEYDLVRLYQGRVSLLMGYHDEAALFWAQIAPTSPVYGMRRILDAELFLVLQDYASAEAAYRTALQAELPVAWRRQALTRLAALRASSDPPGAMAEIAQIAQVSAPRNLPSTVNFLAPLMPRAYPDAQQISVALESEQDQRALLLGQMYLDAGWYALAEAQFTAVAPASPNALAATTYAAYTAWRSGARAEGQQKLEQIVDEHPDEPRARALLALIYLSEEDSSSSQVQLDLVRAMAPRSPDTYLAWAQWYAAHHDYVAAEAEYQRARLQALPEDRGRYALAQTRFYLQTGLRLCESAPPIALEAVMLAPQQVDAWVTLAQTRLACSDLEGAVSAAQRALELAPTNAEATYYLGQSLALLGRRSEARSALIKVVDLAPASPWRARAETQLARLGG